ncbi:zinc finger protein 836 [Condylostylus longicornis]|uniref:zinc finger protein 836 n=1 Tax=Condylostylus longicornis TaxID=2530218 RepID=UPI00244E3E8C|nr:zinc finger protein 836 [Condylostylus longicornis]
MELNDNSSTKKSSRKKSSTPTLVIKNFEADNTGSVKQSVVCTFCSKRTEENFAILNDKPELLGTLSQLDIEILPINDYLDYICYQCVFKIHCIQDYKRIWTANINKTRINHYYRCGNKEMVRRLITLKPSTSARATHQSRTRSNASSFNGNQKEGSIISHSTDNNSNYGKDDCSQNSEKEVSQTSRKRTSSVSSLKISNVNSLHSPVLYNKERRRNTSLVNSELGSNMPRRSSILTNETTDLSQTNNSLTENGFFQENSIHTANDSISTPNSKKSPKTKQLFGKGSTPTNPIDTLLNVMYEENEPAAMTESGGEIASRMSLYKEAVTMKCKYCERVYKRVTFLIKHQRKHERDNQRTTSLKSISSKATTKPVTVFDCPECDENFPTKRLLNKHKKVHLKTLTCQYCSKIFILKWEADFHEAICSGTTQAKQSKIANPSISSNVTRYYTRSIKSKIKKTVDGSKTENNFNNNEEEMEEDDDNDLSDTTDIDSLFSSRMRNTKRWTEQVTEMQNENDVNNTTYNDTGHFLNLYNKHHIYNKEKDNFSTSKTRNSKRKRSEIVPNKVQTPIITYDPYDDISNESYHDDRVFFFIKCQNNGCEYQNVKLQNVMAHDAETHGVRPLYYCKKCKKSFLRKHYYKLHIENQDPGCYLCYKCRAEFFYEELLHSHLNEHHFMELNNEVYPCIICNMQFLDETTLMRHFATREHLILKARPKITFKIRNSYRILQKSQQNSNNNDSNSNSNSNENSSNNMIYDSTLLREGQLLQSNCNLENNNSVKNESDSIQKQYSQSRILKLKKFESKNYKYECNCIKKNCYNCQKHRKMIPSYGKEPRQTKYFPHRSCNEVRLPFLKTWWFRYLDG